MAADDWTLEGPHGWLSGRHRHAMAYIGSYQTLMFGGNSSVDLQDTWVYDLLTDSWTPRSPANPPGHRNDHGMSYIGDDKVLLFGGTNDHEATYGDTWIYDLSANTWTNMNPTTAPTIRWDTQVSYLGDDQVLLFGGNFGFGNYSNETWVYDLSDNTWTPRTPPSSPPATNDPAMSFIGDDKFVLFGGGTWIYDFSDDTWTQMAPPSSPSNRAAAEMAYIGGDQAVLFGGLVGTTPNNETWVYDFGDDTWVLDSNTAQPAPRFNFALSETSLDGSSYIVLFSGALNWVFGTGSVETWTFGGGDYVLNICIDQDSDGFGDPGAAGCSGGGQTDCNDGNGDINPGADEICDGLDNDCDGTVDQGAIDELTWYLDADEDTYGDAGNTLTACTQPVGYVANNLDCDDANGGITSCNTPVSGTPVVQTDSSGNASIEFPNVTTPGDTTVDVISCSMQQPDGFTLNTSATCYAIETTANSSTGEKKICITYPNSLVPLPTHLFQCSSTGASNCCAIALNGTGTFCPPGTPTPYPTFFSQSAIPPDDLEVCITAYNLSHFGFGELQDATDSDFDTIPDTVDNCPAAFNPLQEDADLDGKGDACDPPQVDDTTASDVSLTPTCAPTCQPSDFPVNWGTLHTFQFTLPPNEPVSEVVISGTWGDVDSFDSSAAAEIYLDGVLVAECTELDPCWLEDGQFIDWSFSFLSAGIPDLGVLFGDGEAALTAIQNGEISLIMSNLHLQVYTNEPVMVPISPIASLVMTGLLLSLGSFMLWNARNRKASMSL